ncbi:beta-lactamase family protein [Acidovorax sp. GBBC 3334]|uniref:serine hydrolase domain-containing protein n=1 Tax=Acidovorax sp. GBBC 3334 TaxID=2940496 RepID=UPI002302B4BF|nr:serine hydrolase domain-containing protein [Acidovorax sp. GBBC 3334]MDA8457478.1 beta-lactamase family protein [Acidovorax sp. GBBC 3334]
MKLTTKHSLLLLAAAALAFCAQAMAQVTPVADGGATAPDEWLLAKTGPRWFQITQPSPNPSTLNIRAPSAGEKALVDRACALVGQRPAKAFALMDGNAIVYSAFNAPADSESLFFGMSMGKTVTAMAVGQAICAGKLTLQSKAGDVLPELQGKALGNATVHDLLRMASAAAEQNGDSTIWTPEQTKDWNQGLLNLAELIATDRIAKAARGALSEYKPGEVFAYKSTDPMTLGLMVSRATGMPLSQWIQEQVLNPMGAAHPGLYSQDRAKNGLGDSGMRLRMEDWMRFAVWVKESSKKSDCFGGFVKAAMTRCGPSRGCLQI